MTKADSKKQCKRNFTIDFQEPFYYLKEKKKWWIIPYNQVIEYNQNFDYIETLYMKMSGQEIPKTSSEMKLEIEHIVLKEGEKIDLREEKRTVWYVNEGFITDITGDDIEYFNDKKISNHLCLKKGLTYTLPNTIFFVKMNGEYIESYDTYDLRRSLEREILEMYVDEIEIEKSRITNLAKKLLGIVEKEVHYLEYDEDGEEKEEVKREYFGHWEKEFEKEITKFIEE